MSFDLELLQEVADEVNGDLRTDYSGRGMNSETCVGIVCDDDHACIEAAATRGIKKALVDNMGRQYIVYWPKIKY